MHFFALSEAKLEKLLKKIAEKFGGKEKSRTFAIPNEKRGTKVLKFGNNKFIEKTVNCTRSKYREYNKIYREALISLEIKHDELSRQRRVVCSF